jgi:acyl-CoA hydrolase
MVIHDNADAVVDAIIARVGKTIVLALPLGLGKANRIANALYARALVDASLSLTIFTALSLEVPRAGSDIERRFLAPVAERIFGGYVALDYARDRRVGALPANVTVHEFFMLAGRWLGVEGAQRDYISANYTHVGRYLLDRGVNVAAQLVARRGDRCSLSCNPDLTLDLLKARGGDDDFVFVGEVNEHLPFMAGDAEIGVDAFAHLLEAREGSFTLFAPPKAPLGLTDHAIGFHVARLIRDGGTLQIGIGSVGDGVSHALCLRQRDNALFRDVVDALTPAGDTAPRELAPFDVGLYGCSEMLVDGFLQLMRSGVLKREVDGVALHAAFFLGPRDFYAALRDMSDAERARIGMTAVSFVNDLSGDAAGKRAARAHGRFVNNTMMATALGAAISDALEDGRIVSGVGGQYNFVAQALALDDARSILTLGATRETPGGVASNIVWSYGHTTIPRHLRDIFVTEYGVADLRGKTDAECVAAMLAIADSRFQGELLRRARSVGKIAPTYEIPAAFRDNTPERIERALKPAQERGLLPMFPFGTDFTPVEQRLIPALQRLKAASASPLALARLAWRGSRTARTADSEACLDRMGLAKPNGLRERLYATALRGALG